MDELLQYFLSLGKGNTKNVLMLKQSREKLFLSLYKLYIYIYNSIIKLEEFLNGWLLGFGKLESR